MQSNEYKMRMPCKFCQHEFGKMEERNGQNCVYCIKCSKHQYNAPKAETGEAQRSIRTREEISPGVKAEVLQRDGSRCQLCGRGSFEGKILHMGHIVSVHDAEAFKLKPEWVNKPANLITLCEECNLGMGKVSMTPRVLVAIEFWRKHGRPDANT